MSSTPEDGETEQQNAGDESRPAARLDQVDLGEQDDQEVEYDAILGSDDVVTLPELDGQDDERDVITPVQVEIAPASDLQNGFHIPNETLAVRPGSSADSASIPDDAPSIRGSILSSSKSEAGSPQVSVLPKPSTLPRRPFDRRFQSRMSSSYLQSPRSNSPAFLGSHSRQSSLASFGPPSQSETADSGAPWEIIRWTRLRRLSGQAFSEIGRRNFGSPTCLAVTDQIVIGTSRGLILIFDHSQNSKAVIGSGTSAAECGSITSLAVSADHTAIAAGHSTGHIFTWEISRHSKPFLHIPPLDTSQAQARTGDGHISGSAVLHIGFLGYRRTALVSADDRGMAFSHLASRGLGSVARTVRTTRILGRYPELVLTRAAKPPKKSSVLAFSPLPLGNVEQVTDSLGLVAMLTPYLLVIVSTTPIAQTQHKAARPREVAAHGAMTAALAWFPAIKLKGSNLEASKSKLVYAWSDVLSVLEIHDIPPDDDAPKDKPPELQFLPRSRYKAEEAIVAVQWLSRSVIAALTITQQLLIIEDVTMRVTDSFDLLPKNIYHADLYSSQLQAIVEHLDDEDGSMHGVVADGYHMSFRSYKGRLFLLGSNDVWWGSLTNWADRLLAMMDAGDFIGAIRLATSYYAGSGEKATIGLPEEDSSRTSLVREKLIEMMVASLKYAFGKNKGTGSELVEREQLADLAVACIAASLKMDDQEFLFDEVFSWYDDNDQGAIFVDVLEPHILDGQIVSLPPAALKTLIGHFAMTHTPSKLEEIICLLDATSMDIDQVTTLCKRHNLYDANTYVWNTALNDYVTPLEELIEMIPNQPSLNGHANRHPPDVSIARKMYAYLSFILTGRSYPTGIYKDEEVASLAKYQLYDCLFSGRNEQRESFSRLRNMLHFDTPSMMGALNEAFEDSFLNTLGQDNTGPYQTGVATANLGQTFNREIIVRILLDVMSTGFDAEDTIYLDMFIARNLPKYPQFMRLPGSLLQEAFTRLCHFSTAELYDDAQLSVEYLLSIYQPPNLLSLVPVLHQARFYRVLKSIYRQEQRWPKLVEVYFENDEDQTGVFEIIAECLKESSILTSQQRHEVVQVIKTNARSLLAIDVQITAEVIDKLYPELHQFLLDAQEDDPKTQFRYLRAVLEPESKPESNTSPSSVLLEQYVQLMCQYNPSHVVDYIHIVKDCDVRLAKVVPAMEASGNIDAAVILLTRQGYIQQAMERLIRHLSTMQSGLRGILASALHAPDAISTNEAIEDLLESINKYANVGVWICQLQTKNAQRLKSVPKSPRRSSTQQPLTAEEDLWLELTVAIVSIAQDVIPSNSFETREQSDVDEVSLALRGTVQNVFSALLLSTTAARESPRAGDDFAFLRILRAFLNRVAESSPSLSALRSVIASIFSAYAYEESILSLSNSMLDKDLFVQVDEVSKLRRMGWRPRGQCCEICRRRVWGAGTGLQIWEFWEHKEQLRQTRRNNQTPDDDQGEDDFRGKGKAAAALPISMDVEENNGKVTELTTDQSAIVVFSCRHLYHRKCLEQSQQLDGANAGNLQDGVRLTCSLCV